MKGKIPVDEVLRKFGYNVVSDVLVAGILKKETISHIPLTSDIAFLIWNCFAGPLRTKSNSFSIAYTLKDWTANNNKNVMIRSLCLVAPIFICWELWKNICAIRYGDKRTSISRIRHDVLFSLEDFYEKEWSCCRYELDLAPALLFLAVERLSENGKQYGGVGLLMNG